MRKEAPWSKNRWGHKYQAVSLTEYHYLRDGNPETHESALLEHVLRPGMTVVDVGANHGLFSFEAAHLTGPTGRIHAFEPTPSTRALLQSNFDANGVTTVKVFSVAVSDAPGMAKLRVHRELSGLNTLATKDITWNQGTLHADEIVEVPVTTLDDHAAREGLSHIDFLKIDVEGFELSVIRGARKLLKSKSIDMVMVEIGDVTCENAGVSPMDLLNEFHSLGYHLYGISETGEINHQVESFPSTTFSANFLALPATEGAR
ncbi:FkbM family methyltransferase [Singulisphaera sp. PoT]|uniref:FkbM family methyltransferase n=1 Tax=Singulisphaera sp. PoT TaxID=3411797 RepID=UPI003BF532F1